jgi:hypothetical protein
MVWYLNAEEKIGEASQKQGNQVQEIDNVVR